MRWHLLLIVPACLLGSFSGDGATRYAARADQAPAVADVAANMAALVQADWIDQDRRYRPGQSLKAHPPDMLVQRHGFRSFRDTSIVQDAPSAGLGSNGPFSLAHTRDVMRRAEAVADRLSAKADPKRLKLLAAQIDPLKQRLVQLDRNGDVPVDQRRQLYLDARRLLRSIAFTNPLLADIDKLLFIKRHDSVGVVHMCDQYYGCNAKPGGGLFILHDPFTDHPKLTNLLANSVVQSGRLAGQKLDAGTFLSPELSFDGKTIVFAYSEADAYAKYQGKPAYEWTPECCYHIFSCRADGSELVQLTDGSWEDFDPCFLPNGRVVFVTTRRGGYLRCGRHCPVYTMYSMEPDGSDVVCLSFHETHEWHPSVDNHGMLVYSRWDYVDRDTNIAHHIWLSYPDGRDPRSYHGNYPANHHRNGRPWMEQSIRAVPGSNKYVAVTGAHHGHAFGSLVLIDHQREDDGACSQITRLTPDVHFSEAEKPYQQCKAFGTPWPLSEMDYLCVYDAHLKNRGIYWLDADGNRELIYRDPSIHCLSPIPLQARPRPPVIPDQTTQTVRARQTVDADGVATVAVMNVYDSDFTWPKGTKINRLRVIQLLPKSTAPPNQPRIGVANQTNARAVLGTVPVEEDGSAYFEAPVGKAIYFQALDEDNLAIQSMRSATYVHPGERLTCQGCHEPKHRPPHRARQLPLALQRRPSSIEPGPEGSNPFNYPRLVQPVLDRHCVQCHREKKNSIPLDGRLSGTFTASYDSLAGKYGFYFDVANGSIRNGVHGGARTRAGQFGAKAAPLMKYLDEGHYGVKLPQGDFERVTLWLDCNSEFLGAYEDAVAQAQGQVVHPSLD